VAPAHWARVRSEVSGVVREVKRNGGDTVQEGDVIAVLDSNEQRDTLEAARLALTRERQKLADLELRLQQNRISATVPTPRCTTRSAAPAQRNPSKARASRSWSPRRRRCSRVSVAFTIKARGQLMIDGRSATALHGAPTLQAVDAAMASYVERAEAIADHLSDGAGDEAGRELRARLDSVRFTFALAESSMREIPLEARGRGARPSSLP
jgi:multidrug resistance efflux pump